MCDKCENILKMVDNLIVRSKIGNEYELYKVCIKVLSKMKELGLIEIYAGDCDFMDSLKTIESETHYTVQQYFTCTNCNQAFYIGACIRGTPQIKKISDLHNEKVTRTLKNLLGNVGRYFLDKQNKVSKTDYHWRYNTLEVLAIDLKEILGDIIYFEDNNLYIKFHKDFVISIKLAGFFNTYINGIYHYNIDDQDIWYFLKEIVDDKYVIVQYKHKHGFFQRNRFKFFDKDRFMISSLKHINDIQVIFDINGIITSNNI